MENKPVTNGDLERAPNGSQWQCYNPDGSLFNVQKLDGQYLTWGNFGIEKIPISNKKVISIGNAISVINKADGYNFIESYPELVINNNPKNKTADDTVKKIRTNEDPGAVPGKRLSNPLGYLSSYTYQISLYLISPEGYNAFINSGRKDISKGTYLIARSGGINTEQRARGFEFDYYIDNLKIKTNTSGKATGTSTNSTDFSFSIIEPYGFSFVSNLRRASNQIEEITKKSGYPINKTRQFFILGVRFFGYDELGNIVTGDKKFDDQILDPNAYGKSELFSLYYDIFLDKINFKIEGKSTVYNITAKGVAPGEAFSTARGMIDKTATITAGTVEEALDSLIVQINKHQQDVYKKSKNGPLTQYAIKYIGTDSSLIKNAKIVTKDDLDKLKMPGSNAKTTAQSNDAIAVKTNPNTDKRTIQFTANIPILQGIDQIIRMSDLAKNALKVLYDNSFEPDPSKQNSTPQDNPPIKKIVWYNCSAEITGNIEWHAVVKDWAYTITYLLQTYETPVIDSVLAVPGKNYYGPHKRYEYWYTGKNSEILSYSQTLDNAWVQVFIGPQNDQLTKENKPDNSPNVGKNYADNPAGTPQHEGKITSENKQGAKGPTPEAVNNYVTSLYDAGAQAAASIEILGDPDFLCQDSSYSENSLYNRFYGTDGFTINPNGAQVFIEIDFKEAVDYTIDGVTGPKDNSGKGIQGSPGTLSLNDSIRFWHHDSNNDSNKIRDKGLTYQLITVESSFSSGSFRQKLSANMVPIDDPNDSKNQRANDDRASAQKGPVPGNSTASVGDSGHKKDPEFNANNTATSNENSKPKPDYSYGYR